MWGLRFSLEGLYFASFRRPASTSLVLTYSVPPFTTVRGVLSNALGLKRDDLTIQDWFKIGIKPVEINNKSRELAKYLKLISREMKFECQKCGHEWAVQNKPKKCPECAAVDFIQIPNYKQKFPSAPLFKEFLTKPRYEVFLAGDKEKIERIHASLKHPARPLYIGGSDDLVDIEVEKPFEVSPETTSELSTLVEGIHEDSFVEKIPYKFHQKGRKFSVEYKTVSVPANGSIKLTNPVEGINFGDEVVWVG